ncbi:MAG: hypothetical protein E3J94_04645 [Desulfobacteraceae bacterium]|nr:MAG: hypothetical protein E3J94_04645 [Desulfobacteraceae bacterium]
MEKFWEIAKYMNYTSNLVTQIAWHINAGTWQSLSPKEQEIFRKAVEDAHNKSTAFVNELHEEALKTMKANGVIEVHTETGPFREAVKANIKTILGGDKASIELYKKIISGKW